MFKSVFSRYVCAFVLIILLSFTMLSILLSAMISSYASEEELHDLYWASESSVEVIKTVFLREGRDDFKNMSTDDAVTLGRILSYIAECQSDLVIFTCNEEGRVLVLSDEAYNYVVGRCIPSSVLSILSEGSIYRCDEGLEGIFPKAGLVLSYPVTNDEDFVGAVFACEVNSSEDVLVNALERTVLLSSLWVMLAAIVAAYFITERMVSPLKSVVKASKQYARGDFSMRVPITSGENEITELARSFNDMADALEKNDESRNTFLSNVAHDLRTPMTSISGFIDNMASGAIPKDKQAYYFELISGEVHRLSRLVSQLLEISRYESGKRKYVRSDFDICEMARLILISFEQKIEEKHLNVDFDIYDENITVNGDKDAIYQVLYNLCDNAIKFACEKGDLRITVKKISETKLSVSVYNEGEGIPEVDFPYIFDRFYKSDKSRGRDKSGFGIGLFIAKTIMDAHGESISVSGKEGEGCEFTFTLPIVAGNL